MHLVSHSGEDRLCSCFPGARAQITGISLASSAHLTLALLFDPMPISCFPQCQLKKYLEMEDLDNSTDIVVMACTFVTLLLCDNAFAVYLSLDKTLVNFVIDYSLNRSHKIELD